MARLARARPNARLLCVGGGSQLEEMKRLADSLGLGGRVVFTGLARDIRPFVAAMDVFALCSQQEGNPNVVLQAMAITVPIGLPASPRSRKESPPPVNPFRSKPTSSWQSRTTLPATPAPQWKIIARRWRSIRAWLL